MLFEEIKYGGSKIKTLTIHLILATFLATLSCGNSRTSSSPVFDGDQAYRYLVKQAEFGPRVPGTKAHRDCLNYLVAELQQMGAMVTRQHFMQSLPRLNKSRKY